MKKIPLAQIFTSLVAGVSVFFLIQSCSKEIKEVYIYQHIIDALQGQWKSENVTTEQDGCINLSVYGNSIDVTTPENYTDPYVVFQTGTYVFEIVNDSVMAFGTNKTDLRPRLYNVSPSTLKLSGLVFYKQ